MTAASPQPTAARKMLEVTTALFAATTVALVAGVVMAFCHVLAPLFIGAGGATLVATFGIGMKVFEHLSHNN